MSVVNEQTIWGIHAGRTGDADTLFLRRNVVALGWSKIGDLAHLSPDREAFKKRLADIYPEKKPGAIPVEAGQLFRFVHEMMIGDLVAYPSKRDRQIHIGRVEGPYNYSPKQEPGYPHQRGVRWLKHVPRTRFSQGALYESGSALGLFQIKNYAEEYLAMLSGKEAEPSSSDDETVALVAAEIEDTTRDFILKRLAQDLKGHAFAHFIAHLLNAMGYHTRISPEGPDGGIDIIAREDELGFKPPIVKVQVKSGEGNVGEQTVSALSGKIGTPGEYGLVITLGTFINPARSFARSRSNLRLIDGNELVRLIFQYYEQFDSRYKGLLPLKQVYVPEPLEETEE